MATVNKAIILGYVGKDPEIKTLEAGVKVANFTIATTDKGYTLQNGTTVPDRTEWHNIVAWRGLAEVTEKYIRKGSMLYVEGKIQTRSWEKDGIKRYLTEIYAENIQMLASGKKEDAPETTGTGIPHQPIKVEMPQQQTINESQLQDEESGLPF
jgi:single-strand DNA-binding protein